MPARAVRRELRTSGIDVGHERPARRSSGADRDATGVRAVATAARARPGAVKERSTHEAQEASIQRFT